MAIVKRAAGTKTAKGYWRIRISVVDEFGRTKQKGFEAKTLTDAQRKARLWEAKHGRQLKPAKICGTLKEALEYTRAAIWDKSGDKHRIDMKTYSQKWAKALGDVSLEDLTAPILTAALENMGLHSASSINKCALCIRQTMAYAVSDLGWLERSVADDIRKPKPKPPKHSYEPITSAEYDRMLALAEPRARVLLRLTGECGLRPIEALRVRPADLYSVRDRWMLKVTKSKTEAGLRHIPVPDSLISLIEAISPNDWAGIKDPNDHLRKWWRDNSKTRLYDLRGWCSDQWRRRGIPDQARTYLLGHTKISFTQTVYESIVETDLLEAFYPVDTEDVAK